MTARYSARWPAEMSLGFSARVNGAISIPVYPISRMALQASANGHFSKASLQIEWRESMNSLVYCSHQEPDARDEFARAERLHNVVVRAQSAAVNDIGLVLASSQKQNRHPNRSEERRVGKECRSRW